MHVPSSLMISDLILLEQLAVMLCISSHSLFLSLSRELQSAVRHSLMYQSVPLSISLFCSVFHHARVRSPSKRHILLSLHGAPNRCRNIERCLGCGQLLYAPSVIIPCLLMKFYGI